MRILTLASVLALLAAPSAAQAQRRPVIDEQPKAEASAADAQKASEALADAAREKTEALERARDRRMKNITRGICSGC
ncbi:MAG TPA: hypothetical protein VEZ16_12775 [Microvirga sp.]|nr:hypothetical protein [Microvirga sp.]